MTHERHAHRHGARPAGDRRVLGLALLLLVGVMAVELVAGFVAGSLALFADAAHMLTDVAALALALVAASMAARPARGRWTFGLGRVEVLAAQLNGLTLALAGAWIVYGGIRRLADPPEVRGGVVLVAALAGAAASLGVTALLARASRESINVRGAFLHALTDVGAFAGTAVAGALVLLTGWDRFDPLAALAVAGLMFVASASLLRESTRIFLEASPRELDPEAVGRALAAHARVVQVHDLHLWTVTSGFPALSAHVLVDPAADCHLVRRELEGVLGDRFGLTHTTLQVDHAHGEAHPVELGTAVARRRPL